MENERKEKHSTVVLSTKSPVPFARPPSDRGPSSFDIVMISFRDRPANSFSLPFFFFFFRYEPASQLIVLMVDCLGLIFSVLVSHGM